MIQSISVLVFAQIFSFTLLLIFGMCLFATDFISDIEENLNQINQNLVSVKINCEESRLFMIETFRFHIEVRE